ncbi:zinc finger CW-type PWWP domain protein 2-like [Pristis pectinata]|uniref:zinc finger CW-type PWWP domain protein 2-like n=1 Tax=Pristis pectinata TaxID=685728 RepID=UPI00223C9F3E|nr:zinc finger CW-type PWWP domain protein 2-like [Pristis pectinata]
MDLIDHGFYADKVWIQCEYEDCLKWRLLTNEDAACVDSSKPWYCDMNSDSWFNCCSVPEESYPEESAFHQYGLKLVYSQLPVGSLVLTKMPGWPRWPSILCPDGFTGEYVIYDKDGFVEQYHTEFLGNPHTRSWISVKQVEPYYTRGKLAEDFKRSRQWYKSALEEARMLSELTSEGRLKMCKLSNEVLKKSYNRKSREFEQNKSIAGEKENTLSNWSVAVSEEIELQDSTGAEDCTVIDGIEFRTGKCIEEISNQLKEIDVIMAELEGCL